ncbi:MAG TPA: S9 family peptidase [Acidobacteriaceae bacterium]|jgi:dipeptidyl aminopeptidase/acylaminoacyl peptidase|nr:S9 family peptidase [Acidobacteriaceae bacterium]
MSFEDLMQMRRLGDIDVSRDGRWVLFSATDVDLAKNTRTSHLWIVPVSGGEEKPLTDSAAGESRGRFSPDGKQILLETSRRDGQQIWLADFDSDAGTMGEPHQLTYISTEADNATWSPDGKHILFTSEVYPECSVGPDEAEVSGVAEDACDRQKDEEQTQSKVKAKIFTHLLYRHWNHFTDDKRSHLFLISVDDGVVRDLNPGDDHDVPPFSLGEPDGWEFSPDGHEIAFEEKKVDDPALSTNVDLFTLKLFNDEGKTEWGAKPHKISTSLGGDFTPRYSPDGKWIAWRMQKRAGYESDRFRLVVYNREAVARKPASESRIRELLPDFDRWVDEEAWAPDSKALYFVAGDKGEEPVYRTALDHPKAELLNSGGEFSDLHPASNGNLLIASRMTVAQPAEVAVLHLDQRPLQEPLTHLNSALLAQLTLPKMESFWFPSIGGVRVQGFLIKPPDFDPHKKYPVKFLIHGGPQGAWGDAWSYRWNAELFAANGYVVVMINPGGSTGYGQAFVDRVNGDWGGRPFIDLMRGLDYAELHYPFIDKNRECALGASYGGYMADWILGHTDRFKCIVSHDGMFNPESAYGTTDELWFNEWEFKGTPWTNRELYRRWSPMLAETHFKTPTLVIHSQLDYRLDVSEGFQLFDTLQRMKVPSKMLYFPDEGHFVLKPQNSQLWYRTVNDWVDEWTQKQGTGNREQGE